MTNTQKLTQCYTDVLDTLFDYTGALVETKNDTQTEDVLALVEKITVILKRIGETQVLETLEEDLDGHNNEEEGDDA